MENRDYTKQQGSKQDIKGTPQKQERQGNLNQPQRDVKDPSKRNF